jgi:ketosteroid isomerase-like protein
METTNIWKINPGKIMKGALPAACVMLAALAITVWAGANADRTNEDRRTVAALDTEYQAAVKKNDAATMERLLADDFTLVTGSGKVYSKADLVEEARSGRYVYAHQEDTEQTVRVWGATAVVTAKLWEQGTESGKPIDYTVWFSDTYVRTASGWRYVFGQSSLPLPLPKPATKS